MGWYGPGQMTGWAWLDTVLGTLLLAGLLTAAALLVVRTARRDTGPRRTPERLLAERYARGEIDEEELRRRLDVLRDSGVGTG